MYEKDKLDYPKQHQYELTNIAPCNIFYNLYLLGLYIAELYDNIFLHLILKFSFFQIDIYFTHQSKTLCTWFYFAGWVRSIIQHSKVTFFVCFQSETSFELKRVLPKEVQRIIMAKTNQLSKKLLSTSKELVASKDAPLFLYVVVIVYILSENKSPSVVSVRTAFTGTHFTGTLPTHFNFHSPLLLFFFFLQYFHHLSSTSQ